MIIRKQLRDHLIELGLAQKSWTENSFFVEVAVDAVGNGTITTEEFNTLNGAEPAKSGKSPSPADVFGGARVKKPSERYSTTKSVAKHGRTGLPVRDEKGREVETTSELEYAKAGAFLKMRAARDGQPAELSEHDRELVAEMFDTDKWCGKIGGQYETGIDGARVKSLLNDANSGGSSVVPEFFDQSLISFPLLHSEILPKVDLRDVPRGSSVETASVGNPTVTWGTNEGTAISPFDTASLVAAIDTTIHPVTCALEIGRDFLSDAATDVGRVLVENIGQRLLSELDRVIVKGNGTSEPLGIFNTPSIIDIGNPAGGAGAVPQVNDYEELMFSVGKQYRNAAMRPAYLTNDSTYSRARSIPVGAADARRVFGLDENSYTMMGYPHLICNDLGNAFAAFACLAKYRLYRRMAQEVKFTSEGRELSLKNLTLLVVRGRYGGKIVDPNAVAFCDNMQA
ncbi:MAG: phage major capsid protein [Pirellulales bacterium]|nr:phage major capsid protein [Pirellulales bacterium]